MANFRKILLITLFSLALTGCAVRGKGILLSVEPATPLDERDLNSHCDLGDKAACALKESTDMAYSGPPATFPIVQGVATPDRAVFAALLPAESAYSWFIYDRDLNRLWKLHDSRKQLRPGSAWYVQRIEARELESGRTYELLAGDRDGNLIEDRSFTTVSQEGPFQFGIVSGLKNVSKDETDRLLALALTKKPGLLIFSGANLDATMAGEVLPAKRSDALNFFFEKHAASRSNLAFAREHRLVPVIATWSDAEFGLVAGDRSFQFKDQAREVFEMFFPLWADENSIVNGPGVAKAFKFGGQTLALLDERSFRKIPIPSIVCETDEGRKVKGKRKADCVTSPAPPVTPVTRYGSMQNDWTFRVSKQASQPIWLISPELQITALKPAANPGDWIALLHQQAQSVPINPLVGFTVIEKQNQKIQMSFFPANGGEASTLQLPYP